MSNQLAECRQVDLTVATQNRLACKTAIEALFATAPPYSSSAIRITMFISFFWYRPKVFFKGSRGARAVEDGAGARGGERRFGVDQCQGGARAIKTLREEAILQPFRCRDVAFSFENG